jgi:hypothetical protein
MNYVIIELQYVLIVLIFRNNSVVIPLLDRNGLLNLAILIIIWARSSFTSTNAMLILLLLALIKGILSALSCEDVEIQVYY